jgi:hypothetical protein
MQTIINTIKFPVPRQWLFFAIAAVWLLASVKVFMTAWEGILSSGFPVMYFVLVSFVGSMIFTRLVFLKITAKYIYRIHNMENERPSIFSMFSLRSYLLLVFMITMGITFKYLDIIPVYLLSMFLGALGLSLFTSSMHFLRAWRLKTVI